ncbi:MAG TPA: rRNA methyltransferase [Acidaminococcaceae bacterium]|nr:rRNA methyltransferase [Acidaminococcaceae bacterium]
MKSFQLLRKGFIQAVIAYDQAVYRRIFMEIITSVNNQRVKDVANLKQKKFRMETGTFFAEGLRSVKEAVQYADVTDLFFTKTEEETLRDIVNEAEEKGVHLYCVDEKVMAKLSDTKTPQGVLAVIRMPANNLRQLRPGTASDNNAPVIILDRVQDPGNLGTIIRTADAVGALGIILLEGCVDAYSPKVVRASMGSLFHLPVIQNVFSEEALAWCYRHGYEPAATALKNAHTIYKADLSKKMAFIFGNEANGVSEELQAAAETRLFIPMAGQAESMNVAMAAGIILFEGMRQRKFCR